MAPAWTLSAVDCVICGGWGQLAVFRITKAEERNGRTE